MIAEDCQIMSNAAANGYFVIDEYINRAQSGTPDNQTAFQQMIADSDKQTFEAVLVYQLDRFARNRYVLPLPA